MRSACHRVTNEGDLCLFRRDLSATRPSVEVSWQVTGIRHDAYAEAHRVVVEEAKLDKERGTYLHPELCNSRHYIAEKN
jgi:hypothetical protein